MIQKAIEYIQIPKKIFWGAIIILIFLFGGYSFLPKSFEVDAGVVKRAVFQSYVIDEGVSRYKEKRILSAPADGIVPVHEIKAGDHFKKDQRIISFLWDRDLPIFSPFDGVILRVFEKDKRSVLKGTQLFEIGNPEKIEILVPLLTEDVVNIRIGNQAVATKWGGEGELPVKVERIEPAAFEEVSALGVKEQRVNVYLVPNGEHSKWQLLGDGFRLEVKIIKTEKQDALIVPIGALFLKDGKNSIFIIDHKNKIHLQSVDILQRNREVAEIASSLEPGQRVVLYPSGTLLENMKVKVRQEK